jgi:ABC-type hemin transport system substrate-binding protein
VVHCQQSFSSNDDAMTTVESTVVEIGVAEDDRDQISTTSTSSRPTESNENFATSHLRSLSDEGDRLVVYRKKVIDARAAILQRRNQQAVSLG